MATWHQQRNAAGLAALHAAKAGIWRVVSDQPGELASAVEFSGPDGEARARALALRNGGRLVAPPEAPAAFAQCYVVTTESGAVFFARINASTFAAGALAAAVMAERAAESRPWGEPQAYPVTPAAAALPEGVVRLTAAALPELAPRP